MWWVIVDKLIMAKVNVNPPPPQKKKKKQKKQKKKQ